MQLALYCPVYGFYEKEEDTIGQHGDYYTSVSVGGLFGELLAFQFARWFEEYTPPASSSGPQPASVQIIEAGAHDGRLANDVLTWFHAARPDLFRRLDYWIIEPSRYRQQRQRKTLQSFGPQTDWAPDFESLSPPRAASGASPSSVYRIIFSNELLDSMPVHRLGWDAKKQEWFEWGVTLEDGRFAWTKLKCNHAQHGSQFTDLVPFDRQLLDILPDGFSIEVCPSAGKWWRRAARFLENGKLLTIDYGLTQEEFLAPERGQGTLRAYHRHRQTQDLLANPGDQDITAHINFTALRAAGESAGLKTDVFAAQEQFLTEIAAKLWKADGSVGQWSGARKRQFHTLTHPEHLGRPFRVLVQSRESTDEHATADEQKCP